MYVRKHYSGLIQLSITKDIQWYIEICTGRPGKSIFTINICMLNFYFPAVPELLKVKTVYLYISVQCTCTRARKGYGNLRLSMCLSRQISTLSTSCRCDMSFRCKFLDSRSKYLEGGMWASIKLVGQRADDKFSNQSHMVDRHKGHVHQLKQLSTNLNSSGRLEYLCPKIPI